MHMNKIEQEKLSYVDTCNVYYVKQCGVLSPILFCIYIDELLSRQKDSHVGCYISDMF